MTVTTDDPGTVAKFAQYADPQRLVTTEWLAEHLGDEGLVVVIETDEDVLLYDTGHIPGAVKVDWHADLNDPVIRDYLTRGLRRAVRGKGIAKTRRSSSTATRTTGGPATPSGSSSSSATPTCRLHGRRPAEVGRRGPCADPSTRRPVSAHALPGRRPATTRDPRLPRRGAHASAAGKPLVDVRSPASTPASCCTCPTTRRKARCAAATSPARAACPWVAAANDDGTFKIARRAARRSTQTSRAWRRSDDVIAYCRIGERSSHTWFVLHYLLGYPKVTQLRRLVDRVGQPVRAPIER